MKSIIYNQLTGKPERVYSGSMEYAVVQVQKGESILFVDDSFFLTDYYIDPETAEIRDIPPKPDDYSEFNWQTKQWAAVDSWLAKAGKDAIKQTNQLASQKILSKYPIYKQLNLARTDTAQVMYSWIDNIRNLSNIANANIETSTTLEQINSIVENFKTELGNIA